MTLKTPLKTILIISLAFLTDPKSEEQPLLTTVLPELRLNLYPDGGDLNRHIIN